jgi:general secretion pathway protein N
MQMSRNRISSNQDEMADNTTNKLTFKQKLLLCGLGLFCVAATMIIFLPAVWVSHFLQRQTEGRFVLDDAEGSLWNGSAFIGVAVGKDDDLTPLLPGRFEWRLSPIALLGQIELLIQNADTLQQPLYVTGNFQHIQVSPNAVTLPAQRLAGLGAPLNTIKPQGKMILSWNVLGVALVHGNVEMNGTMQLTMKDMSSALSNIKPLGSYLMNFNWHGNTSDIELKTLHGPMLLNGTGTLTQKRLRFSGTARAEKSQEDNLVSLLNLLGQRRPGPDKNVVSLEFK